MGYRVLTREELDALTPEAIEFMYHQINCQLCPADTIEKTLLHAVLISRFEHFKLGADMTEALLEKVMECGDGLIGGVDDEEWLASRGCC